MKAAPTLDGRVRIDPESELDLAILRALLSDAQGAVGDLVASFGEGMHSEVADDWREFVQPDLADQFNRQLVDVAEDLANARPGEALFIGPDRIDAWYGSLNQARLALEEEHEFSDEDLESMDPERASARIRFHFYGMLQELMLEILF